ncbi:MAG: SpoIIE family protein phosphatase [Okeania sp. SIO3I5]|uniref:SpoIIE family protein phosphatase n=1 Tax=Okeania sp. SIO3I5 TaxID=2607805 RepID=UPI0013B972E9|nr:SpoIIE family protein phosphatase [Okeania sp. SIO3I5]NEQ41013.1 SpoIIE family protein phosphatase [Okeania sp. SIO3I5]
MSLGDKKKLKLMVVDDEPDNLDLLYRTFRKDFKVYKADSAFTAMDVLEAEGEMALIISDQRMPEMNGTEFLGQTLETFPDTVRILLTGYTDVEDLVEAINSGKVFKYITKPWNPEELKVVVQQASETYKVVKQRTNALTLALRRESILNEVMSAIRESLDYSNMLSTIVQTVGRTFTATEGILWPVEGDRLISQPVSYQSSENTETNLSITEELLLQVVQNRQTYFEEGSNKNSCKLIVPLIYQQDLLAVLALNQENSSNFWSSEDIGLIESVLEQGALALSQAQLYQRTRELAEKMRSELEVARQIQGNLLRQSWPDFDNFRIQACCYPAREVGGDFFEVYTHPQGEIWLALGDVSGKGVPAALFMASAISVMRRELSQENPPDPYEVMQNLNSSLSDDLISNNCFITMVLARYTPETGSLAYANAGHIYPLVWSKTALPTDGNNSSEQEPNFLKDRGIPIGILPIWKGKAGTIDLDSGDVFLLTSDGITEATVVQDGTRVMLQQEGLWELLQEHKNQLDLNSLLAYIRADNQVQEDDQTILSLEVL